MIKNGILDAGFDIKCLNATSKKLKLWTPRRWCMDHTKNQKLGQSALCAALLHGEITGSGITAIHAARSWTEARKMLDGGMIGIIIALLVILAALSIGMMEI